MKIINKSFCRIAALTGCFTHRQSWFVCGIIPAIPNQRYAIALMLGTHRRYGLMLGNRWVINGQKGGVK